VRGSAEPRTNKHFFAPTANAKFQHTPGIKALTMSVKNGAKNLPKVAKPKHSRVEDAVTNNTSWTEDIDSGQGANNYTYDNAGRLKEDLQRNWRVNWSPFNKIISQTPATNNTSALLYTYDVDQNRLQKQFTAPGDVNKSSFYIRDPQGNLLALYEKSNTDPLLTAKELHLYGSNSLGYITIGTGRRYSISNHLGNVMAVVTQNRIGNTSTNPTHFNPEIVTTNDYYAFGGLIPGRHTQTSQYRLGFNGKENDNEMLGEGHLQDYGFRPYLPSIGRFFSVDPLTQKYPELTPFQFASNTPIEAVDLDGLEAYRIVHTVLSQGEQLTTITWDETLPKIHGVFVDSYNYEEMTAQTNRFAPFSEYPDYFPNFSKGNFEKYPARKDGRSLLTLEGEASIQSGAIGANTTFLGQNYGLVAKAANIDLIAIRPASPARSESNPYGSSDLFHDNEIEFGLEGGYYVGGGVMKTLDRNTGLWNDGVVLKYSAGAAPFEIEYNSPTKEISLKSGASIEAYIGIGFKLEYNIQFNPRVKTEFTEYEEQYLNEEN
jgi:RHS repeat-associated protein